MNTSVSQTIKQKYHYQNHKIVLELKQSIQSSWMTMQCVWRRRLCDQRAMEQIPPSALIMRSGGKWVSVGFLIRNVKKHYNILRVWSTIYLSSPGSHIHRALNTHEAQCPQTILRKIRSRTGEVGQTQNAKNDEYTKGICSSYCGQWKVFSDRFPESASGPHQPSPHQFCSVLNWESSFSIKWQEWFHICYDHLSQK